ncbi:hypothetical protein IP92_00950 [Pseudoduganella flava]|uniref:GIY-YIG nuclease family protein n=1 Tax=Pseudoduganella flava TaxID=871742 RepID=A0A562PZ85_9BURK|nr:GIY-YIG nuclease family protein [Pseudoduganella flava]QGZ38696.1 GIY-YIG nuclease family protein [Pseudoduganella flava]TWI49729.1 hypothetical protein IP92_00950 [Pseudoduganella flava]
MNADKRELKRQYREQGPQAGVYLVRGSSGRAIVAGSTDVNGALNRHRFELKMKMHRDAELQRDWAAHGEAGVEFQVLDVIEPRDDPAFDLKHELATLAAMWREELGLPEA